MNACLHVFVCHCTQANRACSMSVVVEIYFKFRTFLKNGMLCECIIGSSSDETNLNNNNYFTT